MQSKALLIFWSLVASTKANEIFRKPSLVSPSDFWLSEERMRFVFWWAPWFVQYHLGYVDDVSFRALCSRRGGTYHATVLPLWRHGEHSITNGVHRPAWVFETVPGVGGWTNFSREMKKCTFLVIDIATELTLKKAASQMTKFKAPWREGISFAIISQPLRPFLPAIVLWFRSHQPKSTQI